MDTVRASFQYVHRTEVLIIWIKIIELLTAIWTFNFYTMALTNIAPDLKSLYFLWWNVRPEMNGNHVHNKAFFRNSEHKTRMNEVRFLIGTQNFFFVPRQWQDEKQLFIGHLLLMSTSNPCYHSGTRLTCVFPLTIWWLIKLPLQCSH